MKTGVICMVFLLLPFVLRAQQSNQAELKEYFYDAEYFFAQESYNDALYDYLELYKNGFNDNANINYKIGVCYLNIPGEKDKSIPYLLVAVKSASSKYKESTFKQTNAPNDAYLYLGNAYRINDMLDKAIEAYNTFKTLTKSPEELKFTDQQIQACQVAKKYMQEPVNLRFTNLGDSVNNNESNYRAVISGDGRTMVYMNRLPFYEAVYCSKFINNSWSAPVNITPQIQSDGDQYVSSITYDGTEIFLTKENAFNSDIYSSKFVNGRWLKSEPVAGDNINTKYWESHASISGDGKTLYFTSNRKGGFGEMDIYKSKLMNNGQWGAPVDVGSVINTDMNEDTPFITENDSVLYFSSQGHETMGGYDIFVSKLKADGQWSEPENLKYPLNTTDDDLFYYPWHDNVIGYISEIRKDGFGKEDIYAVQPANEKPLPELLAELVKSEVPVTASVIAKEQPVTEVQQPVVQKPDTTVKAPLVVAEETLAVKKVLPIEKPFVEKKEIELSPAYFEFDKFELTAEGMAELDKVFDLMKEFTSLRLKLMGFTDIKGTPEYNQKLSEKRAITAMKYLISKGIEAGRLTAVGLGESHFAAINRNPDGSDNLEGRKLNRRVEFEFIGLDNNIIAIKKPAIPENLRIMEK